MCFPADYPRAQLRAQPKGMRVVLQERGLLPAGAKILKLCKLCTSPDKSVKHDMSRTRCCATRIISLQPDFLEEQPRVCNLVKQRGHSCLLLPKYHCELNPIEMFWGASKAYARTHCDYTWHGLVHTVPLALDYVSLSSIRKFARLCYRYMDAYRHGLSGKQAAYAVRQFRSHRRINVSALKQLPAE